MPCLIHLPDSRGCADAISKLQAAGLGSEAAVVQNVLRTMQVQASFHTACKLLTVAIVAAQAALEHSMQFKVLLAPAIKSEASQQQHQDLAGLCHDQLCDTLHIDSQKVI